MLKKIIVKKKKHSAYTGHVLRKTKTNADSGLVRIDNRVVMVPAVIWETNGLVVGLEHRLKRILRLCTVLVDLNGSIVDFGHGNNLDVITEASVLPFAVYVPVHILRYVLLEIIGIFRL